MKVAFAAPSLGSPQAERRRPPSAAAAAAAKPQPPKEAEPSAAAAAATPASTTRRRGRQPRVAEKTPRASAGPAAAPTPLVKEVKKEDDEVRNC